MKINDLKNFIIGEITGGGVLGSINLSDKELDRIIKFETNRIYSLYRESITLKQVILSEEIFRSSEFRSNRTLQLPDCVTGISEFCETKNNMDFWGWFPQTGARDMTFENAMAYSIWMGNGSETMTSTVIAWSSYDQLRNFILRDIQFQFNPNTHRLLVMGHDPHTSVLLRVYVKVPDYELWEDPWVQKWITAKVKRQVAKNLGMFQGTLIGGIVINYQMLIDEATKDEEECKEFFNGTNVPDWFIDFQ